MALVKCKECGEDVSHKENNCPNCGATPLHKSSTYIWMIIILVILVIVASDLFFQALETTKTPYAGDSITSVRAGTQTSGERRAWHVSVSNDEMTGKLSAYAISVRVAPNSPMEFPYKNTEAWLGVGCDSSDEWAYFGFSIGPHISDTDTEHGYDVVQTRIRWDNTVEIVRFTQKWGDNALHFIDDRTAVAKIAGASSVMLELDWYGQRSAYFEIPLNGSAKAIADMRQNC